MYVLQMRPYGRKSYQAMGNRRGRATEGKEQNPNTKPNEEIESTVQASPTRGANDDSQLLSHIDDDGDRSRKPQRQLLNRQQLVRARQTSTQGPLWYGLAAQRGGEVSAGDTGRIPKRKRRGSRITSRRDRRWKRVAMVELLLSERRGTE